MMSVLKNVGKGILYIIGLPFFLLILVLTGVAGIFVLIFMFFKSIILFFTGRSLDDELPEDKKARLIKESKDQTLNASQNEPMVNTYVPPAAPQEEQTNIEEAVFGSQFVSTPKEEPQSEPQQQYVDERSSDEIFDSILGTTTEVKEEEEKFRTVDIETPKAHEEPIREYVPHKSQQRIVEDSEEEEETSATNIYFGGGDE